MDPVKTHKYIEREVSDVLGSDFEKKSDVEGCEVRLEWRGSAFYRQMDVTVTSSFLHLKIRAYRDLDRNEYALFEQDVGKVLVKHGELVKSFVSVAAESLVDVSISDLDVRSERKRMTTEIDWDDEFLNDGWDVSYQEVKSKAQSADDSLPGLD
jgi:hypothetical protein